MVEIFLRMLEHFILSVRMWIPGKEMAGLNESSQLCMELKLILKTVDKNMGKKWMSLFTH